jgi:two-component system sensor histidine kinase BaeS
VRTHLVLVFATLSLVAVGVLVALEGLGIGGALDRLDEAERRQLAESIAIDLADAYAEDGTWAGADLSHATTTAEGAGAWLDVVATDGQPVTDIGTGPDLRADSVTVSVVSDGDVVGTSTLVFASPEAAAHRAHDYLWGWSILAAGVALLVAVLMGWVIAGRLARPLTELADTADTYAAGDHTVRPEVRTGTREVRRLAHALDSMSSSVEASETAQRDMLADVAHELRNPLAVLQGQLEEIRDGFATADSRTVGALHTEVLRMARVVDDLGALAEVEQPDVLDRRPTDLCAIVTDSVAVRRSTFAAAEIALAVQCRPTVVDGDEHRLGQVVGNLLDNSARHCRAGDTCRVSVETVGDEAVVRVADDGPGIAPDDLSHVLERRYRGRSTTGGSGIGLAVVRRLVDLHGGTIDVASELGRGTLVTVRLPISHAPHDAESPPGGWPQVAGTLG